MNPPKYVVLEKQVGQTPLEAIEAWKAQHFEFAGLPATYAGRLDPMASGKLLVLVGEECAYREKYLGLDKEYVVEVVLAVLTDTGDTLGLATLASLGVLENAVGEKMQVSRKKLQAAKQTLIGTCTVPYPAFSSKTVGGKPLFQHALQGALGTISIPEHKETIYKIAVGEVQELSAAELLGRIQQTLMHVPRSDQPSKGLGADFRQDAIRARWNEVLTGHEGVRTFTVVTLQVTCASGTYMRTLANRFGAALNTSGFALSIHRTKVGRYKKPGPFGIWVKKY